MTAPPLRRAHRTAVLPALLALALATPGIGAGAPVRETFDRDSTVLVIPADGRSEQPIPIVVVADGARYLPLTSLARALALDYSWDPYTYRGWIQNDSLRTRFTLDSPLLQHGPELLQMENAVGYDRRGVLLPIGVLGLLEKELAGGRPARWHEREGTFAWGAPLQAARQIRVEEIARRASLRIPAPAPQRSLMVWSPIRGLDVLIDGLAFHPESVSIGQGRAGLRVLSCSGWGDRGSRIRLALGDDVLGASLRYDEREAVFEVATTTSREEIDRGGFRPVRSALPLEVRQFDGPVAVGIKTDPARDPMEGRAALMDLADRLVHILSDTLAVPAVALSASRAPEIAAEANSLRACCTILLGLDAYGTGSGAVQVWTASPRLRWDTLTQRRADDATSPRLLLWSETPALTASASERTASRVTAHLETLLGTSTVIRGSRPSRWIEGMRMPAVFVYPASSTDRISIERLLNWSWRIDLANALAFGVSEALVEARQLEADL